MSIDYRDSVRLPNTQFPMRAGLPEKEPLFLEKWQKEDLWSKLRQSRKNKKKYILHDGPPYANGHLHIGHALNKILKDIINRSRQMMGFDANYVPGWDCHGLPIEWKIEERFRDQGIDKDNLPINEFRQECRKFADKWVNIQISEFQRLGVMGDWKNPYKTMDFKSEALIVREIGKFLLDGKIYLGKKPVLWSIVERTALAEAEIEYQDHQSTALDLGFEVIKASHQHYIGAHIVIWTTTPWTLPANRAISYHRNLSYGLYKINDDSLCNPESFIAAGTCLILADKLWSEFAMRCKLNDNGWKRLETIEGDKIEQMVCQHPLISIGYDFPVNVYHGDFVSDELGTGFVHIAPGHGRDDYDLGLAHNIELVETVAEDGSFMEHVPGFAGLTVYDEKGKKGTAEPHILEALKKTAKLYCINRIKHSYPHSWRSKAPLIFRTTEQWFVSMETDNLRNKALEAVNKTIFYPEQGKKRLYDMIKLRPDWCLSRQRVWGVPIAIFKDPKTGEVLRDSAVMDRIEHAFAQGGADVWFQGDPRRFLSKEHDQSRWQPVYDVIDVWFDSGSSHAFVLEEREDLQWPADLYLEGSDQHRGWFHSSLLESCATRNRAPYEAIITHGFVLAEDGQKMSKSLGNIVTPEKIVKQHGADILRLWVVGSNYSDDLSIGSNTLKQHSESYRRLRNCLRWLLGNLSDSPLEFVSEQNLPEPERWVLHRLYMLGKEYEQYCYSYDFHRLFKMIHDFCINDLSSFYFDIRKDSLYCDSNDSPTRNATLFTLNEVFNHLVRWLAPILCFTAEEAWEIRHREAEGLSNQQQNNFESIHLQSFILSPDHWRDDELADKWKRCSQIRRVILGAIEIAREQKILGASLESEIFLYLEDHKDIEHWLDLIQLMTITSGIHLCDVAPENGFAIGEIAGCVAVAKRAKGNKCARCWQIVEQIGTVEQHPDLCIRCTKVVTS